MAGEAYTLNAVGWQHSLLGDHHKALASCERAVELLRRVGDVQGEADAWDSLGYAHHQLAEHRRAIACYGNAVTLFRRTGDRYSEASTLHKVGDSYRSVGDTAAARASWQRALSVLDDLGHPDADDIRARLQALATAAGSSAAPDTTTRNGRRPAGAVR
jgi:tetratricopeptide (TPR) repeat protein